MRGHEACLDLKISYLIKDPALQPYRQVLGIFDGRPLCHSVVGTFTTLGKKQRKGKQQLARFLKLFKTHARQLAVW